LIARKSLDGLSVKRKKIDKMSCDDRQSLEDFDTNHHASQKRYSLKLDIDAEISKKHDRSKVRTLIENEATLEFIDKLIE